MAVSTIVATTEGATRLHSPLFRAAIDLRAEALVEGELVGVDDDAEQAPRHSELIKSMAAQLTRWR
jgi:hypothetical protein